jgi:hypothetical protein
MRFSYLIAILFLTASSSSAEIIKGSYFSIGPWEGDAYYNDETGEWSHCVVGAQYPNGYNLSFSLTDKYSLGVFLQSRDEPVFKDAGAFEIVTKVDNFDAMFGSVIPIDEYFAGIWYDDLDTAIYQFKKGRMLTVSSKLGIVKFGLKGTFKALNAAYSCASKYQDFKVANFERKPDAEVASADWTPTSSDTSAMYQLATLLINDFGLKDFNYTPPANANVPGSVEFTAFDETIFGIVTVGREKGANLDIDAIMAKDVGTLTGEFCDDGDIAVINSTKDYGGIRTKSMKGMCDSPTNSFSVYMTKQAISEKLVETLIIDYGDNNLTGTHSETTTENLGIIAAKYVTY